MDKKSLIFIDVDGTIYSPEIGKIDPELIRTIKKVRENGDLVLLNSGRTTSFLPEDLYPSVFDGYVLAHGNQILLNGELIYSKYFNKENLEKLLTVLNENGLDFVCYTKDEVLVNRMESDLCKFLLTQNFNRSNLKSLTGFPKSPVYKVESWAQQDFNWDKALSPVEGISYLADPVSLRMDINIKDSKKSSGFKKVLNSLTNVEKTYCFGDALNDLDLFELVDFPIAMENGCQELKEKAKLIAPPVTENGVGQVLENLFLNKQTNVIK